MVEVELAVEPREAQAAADWLRARLKQMGAIKDNAASGVAGSVCASVRSYSLPDGRKIEAWADNYTGLSLRGEAVLVEALVAEYRKACPNV